MLVFVLDGFSLLYPYALDTRATRPTVSVDAARKLTCRSPQTVEVLASAAYVPAVIDQGVISAKL